MKKSMSIFLVTMLLFAFNGCSEKNYDPSNVERITLMRVMPDPAKYEVFVIAPDYVVTHYDFTIYWMENAFDFFLMSCRLKMNMR